MISRSFDYVNDLSHLPDALAGTQEPAHLHAINGMGLAHDGEAILGLRDYVAASGDIVTVSPGEQDWHVYKGTASTLESDLTEAERHQAADMPMIFAPSVGELFDHTTSADRSRFSERIEGKTALLYTPTTVASVVGQRVLDFTTLIPEKVVDYEGNPVETLGAEELLQDAHQGKKLERGVWVDGPKDNLLTGIRNVAPYVLPHCLKNDEAFNFTVFGNYWIGLRLLGGWRDVSRHDRILQHAAHASLTAEFYYDAPTIVNMPKVYNAWVNKRMPQEQIAYMVVGRTDYVERSVYRRTGRWDNEHVRSERFRLSGS